VARDKQPAAHNVKSGVVKRGRSRGHRYVRRHVKYIYRQLRDSIERDGLGRYLRGSGILPGEGVQASHKKGDEHEATDAGV